MVDEKKRSPELDEEFEGEDGDAEDLTGKQGKGQKKDPDQEIADFIKQTRPKDDAGLAAILGGAALVDLIHTVGAEKGKERGAKESASEKASGPAEKQGKGADARAKSETESPLKILDREFKQKIQEATRSLDAVRPEDLRAAPESKSVQAQWQRHIVELLDKMPDHFEKMPEQKGELEIEKVKEKVQKNELDKLSRAELSAAVKLEALEGKFGPASELAYKRSMSWFNELSLNVYKDTIASGLRLRPGGPIGAYVNDTDLKTAYASSPEAFKARLLSDSFQLPDLKAMAERGLINTQLNLDLSLKPGADQFDKLICFENSKNWIEFERSRLAENTNQIEANRRYQVISEFLGIKDEGWKPPEDPAQLAAYCQRADQVCNLMFRVRNYAETIKSLESIDGDFKLKALDPKEFPGKLVWDEKTKRITKMELDLPDSLSCSPENERKLQKLQAWLDKYGSRVEQALSDYKKGAPVRYGDFIESGTVRLGENGETLAVQDRRGETQVISVDGKLLTRNLDGVLRDPASGQEVKVPDNSKYKDARSFDYICDKFSLGRDETTGEILVHIDRSFEKDHVLNYNRWLGTQVGNLKETRRYRPDELVAVQTSSGLPQLIRADRLGEFQAIQALWHHGGKIATCAMDVGMVVAGGVGASAAWKAGRMLYVATNVGRAALGLGGLLDPTFRQMGELGESLRKARHAAILLDVTSGLLRQAPGLVGSSKILFEGKGLAEVNQVIESTTALRRLHSATTKVFAVCDAVYLPMMTKDIIDKASLNMGYNPYQMLDDAMQQIGGNDPRSQRSPEQLKAATRDMLNAYEQFMNVKESSRRDLVSKQFAEIKAKLGTDLGEAYKQKELAAYYLPTGKQLQSLKQAHSDSIPRFHSTKEKTGSPEERVAAAIGLLQLSVKDGKFPEDGVLMRRNEVVEPYTKYISDGEGGQIPIEIKGETVKQELSLKEVIADLKDASLNADNPQTRAVAADALYRLGAMGAGRYAHVLLEHLEKDASNADNKQARMQMLVQVASLIEASKVSESIPPADPDAHRFAQAESFGASSEQLTRRLQELAASEKDPDLRAMSMALLHAHNHKDADIRSGNYIKLYKELSDRPGEFRERVIQQFKAELATAIPDGPKEARDAAIELRLNAVRAFRNFEGSKLEADTFKDLNINEKLSECLTKMGGRFIKDRSPDERSNLDLALRVIDAMMSRKDTLKLEERREIAATATGIMGIPYPPDGKGRTEPAIAKLAVISRMKQIYEDCEPQDRRVSDALKANKDSMLTALKDILRMDGPGLVPDQGWGQYPEMRVAALSAVKSLGYADQSTVNLVAAYLDYDANKVGQGSFMEKNPMVRAAAADALYSLAEYRMRYSDNDIKSMQASDKSRSTVEELGLSSKLYVDELLKREREPAALEVLWRVFDRKQRPDPESLDYQKVFNLESERLDSAREITMNKEMVESFVRNHQNPNFRLLSPQYFEGEMKRTAEQRRQDPYAGFWGWCESCIDSRQTTRQKNEVATENARATAFAEKDRERRDGLTELSKLGDLSKEDQALAIKTLMHLVRSPDIEAFKGGDTAYARIRASELLLRLCDGEANRDIVGNKQLLAKVIVSCLQDSSIDTNPQVKYNLLKCIDALTIKDPAKAQEAGKKDFWLLTPERAAMVYSIALEREKQRFDSTHKDEAQDYQATRALQLLCLQKLYELRGHAVEAKLDSMSTNPSLKASLPDVAQSAGDVLSGLRYGVVHLAKDTPADRASSLSARADYMESALNDSKFNFEGACIAMFRACKDRPIERPKGSAAGAEDREDPRVGVLLKALNHESERVRLSAALLLADSKVDSHYMRACNALAQLAVNGSKERYQKDAASLLKDMIQRGQPAEQDIAYNAWRTAYDAGDRSGTAWSRAEKPLSIPDPDVLSTRKVPVDVLDRLIRRGRDPLTAAELKSIEDSRIRHLSVIMRVSEDEVRSRIADPPSTPNINPRQLFLNSEKCYECHPRKRDTPIGPDLSNYFRPGLRHDLLKDVGAARTAASPETEEIRKILESLKDKTPPGQVSAPLPIARDFDASRRSSRLSDLEAQYGVRPFVSESLRLGKPEIGRPVWGQVRHREADKLQEQEKARQNEILAASYLETRLAAAGSPEARIQALKDACWRTPLLSSSDRRVGKIADFLQDRDAKLRMAAAELVLRSNNDGFVNTGFSAEQRRRAYALLELNAAAAIQTGAKAENNAMLALRDRSAGLLLRDLSAGDNPADGKLALSRTLLDSKFEQGKGLEIRTAVLKELSILSSDPEGSVPVRLDAAQLFIKSGGTQAEGVENVWKSLLDLAQKQDSAAQAQSLLLQLDKTNAYAALLNLKTTILNDKSNGVEAKDRIDLAIMLSEKWKAEPRFEASLYDLHAVAEKQGRPESFRKLNQILDRSVSDSGLSPITGKDDPRLAIMSKLLEKKESDSLKLNAALALSDARAKDVPESIAEAARVILFEQVQGELEKLRLRESDPSETKPVDGDWQRLDLLMERVGQGKEDYSRLYIESKRLELKGDNAGLVSVYEKLAALSRMRGAENAGRVFAQQAAEAKELSEPQIQDRLRNFEKALEAAGKGKTQALEQNLVKTLEELASKTGNESRLLAKAYFSLSAYHLANGESEKADAASTKATQTMDLLSRAALVRRENMGASSVANPHGTRALANQSWEASGDPVKLKDNVLLQNMLDYQFSKAAVAQDANARARRLAEEALSANESVYGQDSLQADSSRESLGDLLLESGSSSDAENYFRQVLQSPNSFGVNRGRITSKLSQTLINRGPEGHQQALVLMESSLQKMQMENVDQNTIAARMDEYARLMQQRGDGAKAQDFMQRSEQLRKTGYLAPPTSAGIYNGLYPGSNQGGPGFPGGPGDPPGGTQG